MSPLEIYQADLALENDIQVILQDKTLGKKEKRKLLRCALQEQSCNAHLRSHVQYYLDLFQTKPADILLTILSACSVIGILLYAIIRLLQVL